MASEERLRELEEKYEDYKVYDNRGDRIGKVDDLFVDETDREEYIGVKLGFFGMKSTLIPMDIARVNEADRTIEVSDTKDHVKEAPSFDDDEDITGEYERRIRDHFGLGEVESSSSRGGYGASSEGSGTAVTGTAAGATAGEHDHDRDHEPEDSRTTAEHTTADREHTDTDHTGERTDSASESDSHSVPEYRGTGESHGSGEVEQHTSGEHRDAEETEGSGTSSGSTESSESSSAAIPNSRQTEETETFREGGRTKVRRRIVREEVVDADDDPDARS